MRYKLIFAAKLFDLSGFKNIRYKKFFGLRILRFDDSNSAEIFNLVKKSYISKNMPNDIDEEGFYVFGRDRYIYTLNKYGVKKEKKDVRFALRAYFYEMLFVLRSVRLKRAERYNRKSLKAAEHTVNICNDSSGDFKKGEFIDKENELCFSYRVRYAKEKNNPIIVYFHGAGSIGKDNSRQLREFERAGEKLLLRDCTILVPQAPAIYYAHASETANYVASVKKLTDILVRKASADKNRIYVFGTSFGGKCTWQAVRMYPAYFAAAMPVMGCFEEGASTDGFDFGEMKKVPFWVAHSSDDIDVSVIYDDVCVRRLKEIGADIRYTRWNEYGHSMSSKFYKNEKWVDWMFEQSLEKRM